MTEKNKKTVRVGFRRNRAEPPRENDVTRQFAADATPYVRSGLLE